MPRPKPTAESIIERFWSHVNFQNERGCWVWVGAVDYDGYGIYNVPDLETLVQTQVATHRYSMELHLQKSLTSKEFVCHRCDNPPCVNPEHLFIGGAKENFLDYLEKNFKKRPDGTYIRHDLVGKCRRDHYEGLPGEKNPNAKLTEDQVREIRRLKATMSYSQLAKMFNINWDNVRYICRRTAWKHVKD